MAVATFLMGLLPIRTYGRQFLDVGLALVPPAFVILEIREAVLSLVVGYGLALVVVHRHGRPLTLVGNDILARTTVVVAAALVAAIAPPGSFVLTSLAALVFLIDFALRVLLNSETDMGMDSREFLGIEGWLAAGGLSASLLGMLVLPRLGVWGLGLIVLMLLVMRQSFAMFLQIRQAHSSIKDMIVRALTAHAGEEGSLAVLLADSAVTVARRIGLQGKSLDTLSYAAIFYGLDALPSSGMTESQSVSGLDVISTVRLLCDLTPPVRAAKNLELGLPIPPDTSSTDCVLAYILWRAKVAVEGISDWPRIESLPVPDSTAHQIEEYLDEALQRVRTQSIFSAS